MFWLCFYLHPNGRPCNRRTRRPLSMCDQHRERPTTGHSPPTREQRRASARRAHQRRELAGVSEAWL